MRPLLLLLCLAGCGSERKRDDKPLVIEWTNHDFKIVRGRRFVTGAVTSLAGDTMVLKANTMGDPSFKSFQFGNEQEWFGSDAMFSVADRMGDFSLDGGKQTLDLKTPMTIRFNDGAVATTMLGAYELELKDTSSMFLGVTQGKPLTFEGDGPDDGQLTLLLMTRSDDSKIVIGPGKRLRDVDRVVSFTTEKTDVFKKCHYERESDEHEKDIRIEFHEATVTVYDRRTAKVVETGTVQVEPYCPVALEVEKGTSSSGVAPRNPQIQAWLETRSDNANRD